MNKGITDYEVAVRRTLTAEAAERLLAGDTSVTDEDTDAAIASSLMDVVHERIDMWSEDGSRAVIPVRVTSIGSWTFRGRTGLTSVTIPDSVTSIEHCAFRDCTGLTSITIPGSVTSIGYGTFWDCESLTSVVIPDSVTNIGHRAFWGCTSLASLTIPAGVTHIGSWAFDGCESLTQLAPGKKLVHTSRGYAAHDFCGSVQVGCESHPKCWWQKYINDICVWHAVDAEERTELEKLLTVF